MVGNIAELGGWDVKKARRMKVRGGCHERVSRAGERGGRLGGVGWGRHLTPGTLTGMSRRQAGFGVRVL